MSILLIAEHNNKEVKPFTYNAISAASLINEDVHVLVIGSNSDDVAKSISEFMKDYKANLQRRSMLTFICKGYAYIYSDVLQ